MVDVNNTMSVPSLVCRLCDYYESVRPPTLSATVGLPRSPEALKGEFRPWDPYGVAKLNLLGLLHGQTLLELTVPITVGPREPPGGTDQEAAAGPLGSGEEGGRKGGREDVYQSGKAPSLVSRRKKCKLAS